MTTRYPQTFPPDEASSWRRIRKYAVPRLMIEQATERRLAGDWRGTCAAAHVDVDFDLTGVAEQHGAETATRLDEDLRHFAPDLLRWHLPRWLRGRTTQRPNQCVILAGDEGRYLCATTPGMIDGPQRLTLRFGGIDDKRYSWKHSQVQDWRFARHLWDARHADELLEHCGGGARAPFRNADGTPRAADELPTCDPGIDDSVGHTEWITLLCDRGDIEQAFAASRITLDDSPPQVRFFKPPPLLDVLARHPLALTRLEAVVRRLAEGGRGDHFLVRIQNRGDRLAPLLLKPNAGAPGLTLSMGQWDSLDGVYPIPEASWRRLPDLDLLRFGDIAPDELHPLIGASLFPERPQPAEGPLGPAVQPSPPVRVRCRGEWHTVQSCNGRLEIPHTEEEERRERAMRAFGGPVTGCFATQQAWTSGAGRLPKALREQREELFARVQHGDTGEVLRLLDAGIDPHVRDGRQRTLLHVLHLLDHELMLPRLLGAGLELEARDHHQRTPVHVAVGEGSVSLVRALLDAGARTDVVDDQDRSLASVILQHKRKELRFLRDAVMRDHPHLMTRYPTWGDLDD